MGEEGLLVLSQTCPQAFQRGALLAHIIVVCGVGQVKVCVPARISRVK